MSLPYRRFCPTRFEDTFESSDTLSGESDHPALGAGEVRGVRFAVDFERGQALRAVQPAHPAPVVVIHRGRLPPAPHQSFPLSTTNHRPQQCPVPPAVPVTVGGYLYVRGQTDDEGMPQLTDADHAILRFEEAHPQRGARAGDRIRAELGMAPAVYFLRLHGLVERPEVAASYPQTASRVTRLRMVHEGRRRARSHARRSVRGV